MERPFPVPSLNQRFKEEEAEFWYPFLVEAGEGAGLCQEKMEEKKGRKPEKKQEKKGRNRKKRSKPEETGRKQEEKMGEEDRKVVPKVEVEKAAFFTHGSTFSPALSFAPCQRRKAVV